MAQIPETFLARWPSKALVMRLSSTSLAFASLAAFACSSNKGLDVGGTGGSMPGTGGLPASSGVGGSATSGGAGATQAPGGASGLGGAMGSGGTAGAGGASGSSGIVASGGAGGGGGSRGLDGGRPDAARDFGRTILVDSSVAADVADAPTGAEANSALCPASFGTGEGHACPLSPGTCDYPEGRCGCLDCVPDGGTGVITSSYWHCRAWTDLPTGCPSPVPATGTACSFDGGLVCNYDPCCTGPSLGPSMQCSGGTWQPDPILSGGCACAIRRCP